MIDPQPPATSSDVAKTVTLAPDPSVLDAIGRGHDLVTAIADLVDNSIDASASTVRVRFVVSNGHFMKVRITDDGRGMTEEQLTSAMTLAKRRDYESGALGHFGLGLKASSLSQAKVLTVYTWCGAERPHAMRLQSGAGRGFDVDVLLPEVAATAFERVDEPSTTGTVVEWTQLKSVPHGERAIDRSRWLQAMIEELRDRLGLTFHRLLSERRLRLEIDVHDPDAGSSAPRTVRPIDPFAFNHWGANNMPRTLTARLADGSELRARCHLLPPNSVAPATKPAGVSREAAQGFYVYRNDRLLQASGWLDLRRPERDLQLARVIIELAPEHEQHVVINHEKHGVQVRADFAQALQRATDDSGYSFAAFLDECRSVLKRSRQRELRVKPVADPGDLLPDDATETVVEQFGTRDTEPARFRWRMLDKGRLFDFDPRSQTVVLNAGYREALAAGPAADLLRVSLFFLLERYFGQERVSSVTLETIGGQHDAFAAACFAHIDIDSFDPLGLESSDDDTLDLFALVASPAPRDALAGQTAAAPTPLDVMRNRASPVGASQVATAGEPTAAERDPDDSALLGAFDPETPAPHAAVEDARPGREQTGRTEHVLALLLSQRERAEREFSVYQHVPDASVDPLRDYLKAVGKWALLTASQEVDLAMRIEAGLFARERLAADERMSPRLTRELKAIARDGRRAETHLLSANLRLVVSVAKRYSGSGLPLLDRIQEGNIGLIRAVQKFDHSLGNKFSTYAMWWIRQAITRAIADQSRMIRVPVHMTEKMNRAQSARKAIEDQSGKPATSTAVAAATGLSARELRSFDEYDRAPISLDALYAELDGEWATVADALVDDEALSPLDLVTSAAMAGEIDAALASTSDPRVGQTLARRFGIGHEPETLDAIGVHFDVTRERIRQLEKRGLTVLSHKRGLRDYLETGGAALPARLLDPIEPTTAQRLAPSASDRDDRERGVDDARSRRKDRDAERLRAVEALLSGATFPQTSTHAAAVDAPEEAADQIESAPRPVLEAPAVRAMPRVVSPYAPETRPSLPEPESERPPWCNPVTALQHYRDGETIRGAAQALDVDAKVVATVLARIVLDVDGANSGEDALAARAGDPYEPNEREKIIDFHRSGWELERIAQHFARTPFAIAWQILDSPRRPAVTRAMMKAARRLHSES